MSATAESEKFAKYFGEPIRDKLQPAPIFDIKGFSYHVDEFFLDDLEELGRVRIMFLFSMSLHVDGKISPLVVILYKNCVLTKHLVIIIFS